MFFCVCVRARLRVCENNKCEIEFDGQYYTIFPFKTFHIRFNYSKFVHRDLGVQHVLRSAKSNNIANRAKRSRRSSKKKQEEARKDVETKNGGLRQTNDK